MAIKDLIAIPIEEKNRWWLLDGCWQKKTIKKKTKSDKNKKNLKSGDGYWMAADSGGARRWGAPPW